MTIPAIVSLASGAARGELARREREEREAGAAERRARQKQADELAAQEREDREAGNRGAWDTLHRHDPDGYPVFMRGFDYQGLAREMLQERRRRAAVQEQADAVRKVFPGIPANTPPGEVLRAAGRIATESARPPAATTVARTIREKAAAQDAAVYVRRHPELAGLSDTEIVRRGRALETRRAGTRGAGGSVLARTRQALTDTRRNITEAERTVRRTRPLAQAPADRVQFTADSIRASRRLPALRSRADSLTAERDSLQEDRPVTSGTVTARARRAASTPPTSERLSVSQDEYDDIVRAQSADYARRHFRVQR